MKHISEIIENILIEWAYRVHDGKPNPKNPYHILQLRESMEKLNIPNNIIYRVVENIINESDDDKYKHIGYGKYKKKGDEEKENSPTYKKDDSGKYIAIGKDDDKSDKEDKKEEPNPLGIKSTEDYMDSNSSEESEEKNYNEKTLSTLDRYQTNSYKNWKDRNTPAYKGVEYLLTDDEKELLKEFDEDIDKFFNAESDEEKSDILKVMVEKYGLRMNASGSKLYIGNINFDARKIFSGESGNSLSKTIGSEINRLGIEVEQPESGSNSPKQKGTTASKIDFDEGTEVTAEDSPTLSEIFNRGGFEPLKDKPQFKKVWGPTNNDGDLIRSGGENSSLHFKFSVDKDGTLDRVLTLLKELEMTHNISPQVREAIENHQKQMQDLADGKIKGKDGKPIKIPSEEAAEFVEKSWSEMAIKITESSPEMANGMMKNLAEKLEYQRELAAGDEVYMPSAGTFPSGDKIKVERDGSGSVVKVDKVSVKYGSSGKYKAYGFPGEAGQYQMWHQDPEYRDRNASRPGIDSHSIGVRNDLVDDDEKFDSVIEESGLKDVLKQPDGEECFKEKVREYKKRVEDEKKNSGYDESKAGVKKNGSVASQLDRVRKPVREANAEIGQRMVEECIDMDKLEETIGKDNARLFSKGPMEAMNIMTFSATLQTGDGLKTVTHNHQHIDKGPPLRYVNETDEGDANIKYWALNFRAFEGRAGGCIASYNSKRKDADFK